MDIDLISQKPLTIDFNLIPQKFNYEAKEIIKEDKKRLFSAVKELKKPVTSTQIIKFLIENINKEIRKEIDRKVSKFKISPDEATKDREFKKLQRKEIRDERTYQRRLKELVKQGILIFEKKKYRISNIKYPEIKLWATDFGKATLEMIMRQIHPYLDTRENNLERIVQTFGVYLVYCFIEAIRPLTDNNDDNDSRQILLSAKEKDKMTISWIKDAIDVEEMFYFFIALLKNQETDDDQVHKNHDATWKTKKDGKIVVTSFTNTLKHLSYFKNRLKYDLSGKSRFYNSKKEELHFEFKDDQIYILKKFLKSKYGLQYHQLEDAFERFTVKNKEGFRPILSPLDKKYQWDTYLDRAEGLDDEKFHRLFPHSTPILAYREYLKDPKKFFKKIADCKHEYFEIVIEEKDKKGNKKYSKELHCKLCYYIKKK
jgi:hypothetical protein